jgi:hypothetical protein
MESPGPSTFVVRTTADFQTMVLMMMMETDLQILQLWTEAFVLAVVSSTKKMPYSMRYLARETLLAVQVCNTSPICR